MELTIPRGPVRTGDVVRVAAVAKDRMGRVAADAPIAWSNAYVPDDSIRATGGAADIRDGKFVADFAGQYTLTAARGTVSARQTIDVRPRDVLQRITITGRGEITTVHVSDLWPWEGRDGRDYCVVGTFAGDGYAYVYDITDPERLVKTDSIQVDARVINDVMVSPDGPVRRARARRRDAQTSAGYTHIVDITDPLAPMSVARYEVAEFGSHDIIVENDVLHQVYYEGGVRYHRRVG